MKKFLIIILLLVIIRAAGIIGYRLLDDKIPVSGKTLTSDDNKYSREVPSSWNQTGPVPSVSCCENRNDSSMYAALSINSCVTDGVTIDDYISAPSAISLPTATIRSSRKSPRRRSRLPSEIIPAIILNFSPKQEASPSAREISFLPQRTDIFISMWFCRKTPMQMRRRPRKTLSLPSNTALTEMYHRKTEYATGIAAEGNRYPCGRFLYPENHPHFIDMFITQI